MSGKRHREALNSSYEIQSSRMQSILSSDLGKEIDLPLFPCVAPAGFSALIETLQARAKRQEKAKKAETNSEKKKKKKLAQNSRKNVHLKELKDNSNQPKSSISPNEQEGTQKSDNEARNDCIEDIQQKVDLDSTKLSTEICPSKIDSNPFDKVKHIVHRINRELEGYSSVKDNDDKS